MMNREVNELRKLFNSRLTGATRNTFYGTVESVDREERTCRISVGDVFYDDVLLYGVSVPENKGLTVFPALGSRILVTRVDASDRLFADMFSVVDSIEFTVGEDYGHIYRLDETGLRMEHGEEDAEVILDGESLTIRRGETSVVIDNDGETVISGKDSGTTVTTAKGSYSIYVNNRTKVTVDGDGFQVISDPATLTATPQGFEISVGGIDLIECLMDLCKALMALQVPTAMGPSGPPINMSEFIALMQKFITLKSKT